VSRGNFDGLKPPNPSSFRVRGFIGKKVEGKNLNGVSAKCAIDHLSHNKWGEQRISGQHTTPTQRLDHSMCPVPIAHTRTANVGVATEGAAAVDSLLVWSTDTAGGVHTRAVWLVVTYSAPAHDARPPWAKDSTTDLSTMTRKLSTVGLARLLWSGASGTLFCRRNPPPLLVLLLMAMLLPPLPVLSLRTTTPTLPKLVGTGTGVPGREKGAAG
jgi:hypothetical protein